MSDTVVEVAAEAAQVEITPEIQALIDAAKQDWVKDLSLRAGKLADEYGHCSAYDEMAVKLGLNARPKKFRVYVERDVTIKATIRGDVVVFAHDEEEAKVEAKNMPNAYDDAHPERNYIDWNSIYVDDESTEVVEDSGTRIDESRDVRPGRF